MRLMATVLHGHSTRLYCLLIYALKLNFRQHANEKKVILQILKATKSGCWDSNSLLTAPSSHPRLQASPDSSLLDLQRTDCPLLRDDKGQGIFGGRDQTSFP